MNGISLEPNEIGFNEAISRIKSCQQMTLTVRKKSGLSLFYQQQKQKIKAIIHTCSNSQSATECDHHSPLCFKHSSESSLSNASSVNQRFYIPSERDYSLSDVESTQNDILKYAPSEKSNKGLETNGKDVIKEDEDNSIIAAQKIYDKVKREEERIAEEKKKLESEQKRLRDELEKLEKER